MGHAGAIITGTEGTADCEDERFSEVGVLVAEVPSELPRLLRQQKAAVVPALGQRDLNSHRLGACLDASFQFFWRHIFHVLGYPPIVSGRSLTPAVRSP